VPAKGDRATIRAPVGQAVASDQLVLVARDDDELAIALPGIREIETTVEVHL
jgi:hypothetical protein